MHNHFMMYWKYSVKSNFLDGTPLTHTASNELYRVQKDDTVWIVTSDNGNLYLVGFIIVDQVTDQSTAEKLLDEKNLWEAKYHALSFSPKSAVALRKLPVSLAKQLTFESKKSKLEIDGDRIWPQQFQKMRQLTQKSGNLLKEFIEQYDKTLYQPTADEKELNRKVEQIIRRGVQSKPRGQHKPKRQMVNSSIFFRDPEVKAWVIYHAKGVCEGCKKPAPFHMDDGSPYLEIHHVKPLVEGGSDRIQNAVALCPNCHRHSHFGNDRSEFTESLYINNPRLVRESKRPMEKT